nr:potassium channel subfamily K member 10-like [Cherax quadricarinatus]
MTKINLPLTEVLSGLDNETLVQVSQLVRSVGQQCSIDFLEATHDHPITWSLWNSFFFTFTVITTIGFGHMSPPDVWGPLFAFFLRLHWSSGKHLLPCGKPLLPGGKPPVTDVKLLPGGKPLFQCGKTLLPGGPNLSFQVANPFFQAANLSFQVVNPSLKIVNLCFQVVNSQVRKYAKRYQSWVGVAADTLLYLVPGMVVFLLVPSAVFAYVEEDWDYLDALYFSFITLTTIGFGDQVAGLQEKEQVWLWVYKIVMVVWIFSGLGYIIMIITFIQKALQSKQHTGSTFSGDLYIPLRSYQPSFNSNNSRSNSNNSTQVHHSQEIFIFLSDPTNLHSTVTTAEATVTTAHRFIILRRSLYSSQILPTFIQQ